MIMNFACNIQEKFSWPNIMSCMPKMIKKESFKWLRGNKTRSGKTHHASWTNIACYWLPYRTMSTARSIFSSEMLYSRKQTSHIMLQGIKHKLLSWPFTVVKLERTISPFTSSTMSYIISMVNFSKFCTILLRQKHINHILIYVILHMTIMFQTYVQ